MTGIEAWFVDSDDGIVINIEPPTLVGEPLRFNQADSIDACNNFSTSGTLSFSESLPPDFFAGRSGSISRFSDRLSLFIEEQTPSRVGLGEANLDVQDDAQQTFVARYDFVNVESLGNSSGGPNQIFTVSGSTILVPTFGTPIIIVGETNKWSVVSDLSTASAEDEVFEYNDTTGKVTFGNGTNGAIPPSGEEIKLKITIKNSGGQWEFSNIEVSLDSGKNIGTVKSVRDKIYYSKSPIVAADISGFGTMLSNVNQFIEEITREEARGQEQFGSRPTPTSTTIFVLITNIIFSVPGSGILFFPDGEQVFYGEFNFVDGFSDVVRGFNGTTPKPSPGGPAGAESVTLKQANGPIQSRRRVWTVTLGGFADATDGTLSGFNTGFTGNFATSSFPRPFGRGKFITAAAPTYPSIHSDADNVATELGFDSKQILLNGLLDDDTFDQSEMGGGASLSVAPDTTLATSIAPIAFVEETQQLNPGIEEYSLRWIIFPPGSIADEFNLNPIINGRDVRLIQIGDQFGSFDDPLPNTFTSEDFLTVHTKSKFSKRVIGSSERHLEWVSMKWETRSPTGDKAYENYLGFGVPTFTATWSFNSDATIVGHLKDGVIIT